MSMMPKTIHGLESLVCISALQKHIRRGNEVEAMKFACELWHSSIQAHRTMLLNRLQIICHEDIDNLADPRIAPFVETACRQAEKYYRPDKLGASRMMIGNAIRMMCRSAKSREGDHFQGAIGLANLLEGQVPEIPDYVWDKHTRKGRNMGRGVDHFRAEATKLHPAPKEKDPYEDEFYRLIAIKDARDSDRSNYHGKLAPMTRNNDHEADEAASWRRPQGEIPF